MQLSYNLSDMKKATAREVQHGFSGYLERASRGESVVITKHGKKMARLVPEGEGQRRPVRRPDFEARLGAIYGEGWRAATTGTEAVQEARGER